MSVSNRSSFSRPGLLLSTSVLALLLASGTPTFAADKTIADGVTVGQQLLDPDDKLTIEAGGKIVDNMTTIDSASKGNFTIINKGTIEVTGGASILLDHLDLDNSGTIEALTQDGIVVSQIGTLNNSKTGVIFGADAALHATTIFHLNNDGTLDSNEYGIQAISLVDGVNTGTIHGDFIAISVGDIGSLTNSGNITATTNPAISASGHIGALDNSGLIRSSALAIGVTGSIGSLTNSGQIIGDTSGAIDANGSIGSITNTSTGHIIGGAGDAIAATDIGSIDNAGEISAGINSNNVVADGIFASVIGDVNNSGTITANNIGVASGSTLHSLINGKDGVISGGNIGVAADGIISVVENSGKITGGTGNGLSSASTIVALNNSETGTIQGKSSGVFTAHDIDALNNSGTITGDTDHGVRVDGTLKNLTNSGTITSKTLDGVHGFTIGALKNSGAIQGGQHGVYGADIGTVDNSKSIVGETGDGVRSGGTMKSLTNTGDITGFQSGITSDSIDKLTNSGTITGETQSGVHASTIGDVINNGSVTGNIAGLISDTSINSLVNAGSIRGTDAGVQANAIFALTNSGVIGAADETGNAIVETDPSLNTDTLLTLNAGSVLIGHVDIHGGTNTLAVGNGLNLALTFDTSVPELIQTSGAPYVVVGNTVYVADMTAFAAAGVATSNLASAIGDAAAAAVEKGFDEKGVDGSGHYWLQAIGGYGGAVEAHDRFGGFVIGGDYGASADQRLGFFVGGARGVVETDTLTNNADSFYAGLYGASQFQDFSVKGALTAGYTNSDIDRTVANNTVATGLQNVNSHQDAFFIAPSITFTKPWVTRDLTLETSLTLNYTGLFSGGFTENVPGGVSVGRSSTHIFGAEGLLRLPFQTVTEDGMLTGDVHTGLEGRAIINPALGGFLAGTPVSFTASDTPATLGIVAGAAVEFKLDSGIKLFGGSDIALRSDHSLSLAANAGIKGEF
jgi:hypothetical protein